MKFSWSEPGIVISAAAHAALLIAMLVSLSNANKFDDAQESVPVETITNAQFNQIMKGEKTAKEKALQPHPKVDKVAAAEVEKPRPPTPDAKNDIPAPPPPLKRIADPGESDRPEVANTPAPPLAVLPPPRPQEAKLEPPLPQPKPPVPVPVPAPARSEPKPPVPARSEPEAKKPLPPPRPDAEVIENAAKAAPKHEAQTPSPPVPPAKPRPERREEPKPKVDPKALNEQVAKILEEKREEPKPKIDSKILNEQVAKILEEKRLAELAAAEAKPAKPLIKAAAKPKSGDEQAKTQRRPDFDAIRQLISHEDPQSTGSTGHQVNKVASLGAEAANSPNMTPTLSGELEGILLDQYKQCWNHLSVASSYITVVEVEYRADGSLAREPVLVSHPNDPALRELADSALSAVRRCNPLRIPPRYQALFEQEWTGRHMLKFDPADL